MENKDANIAIKLVRADEISFVNHLAPGETIQLGFKYTFNIMYSGSDSGRAEMTLVAEDRNSPEKFTLRIVETGFFGCEVGLDRETVHIAAFRALFPYAKALAAMVSAASGVPAVMIPEIDISEADVMRIDYRPPKNKNEE